jgi:NTE family protein
MTATRNRKLVALVLSGGGARGAYEAGVVAELLPALERRGERPTVFVGTSAGAINAAYLASRANEPADVAAKGLVGLWSDIEKEDVIGPLLKALFEFATAGWTHRDDAAGALDVTPLRTTISRSIDGWGRIGDNLATGTLDALAVTATSMATGASVVYCDTTLPIPRHKPAAGIYYLQRSCSLDHVMASAAIPILFPPVDLGPEDRPDWFMDGGVRLNTPIKPAIDLGADRVAIVATEPSSRKLPLAGRWYGGGTPGIEVALLHLMRSGFVDPLLRDLESLRRINRTVAAHPKRGWRECRYLFVGPEAPGLFAMLADAAFDRHALPTSITEAEFWLLSRAVGSDTMAGAELLSYLLFQPAFIETCIEQGRVDAKRSLRWQT